MVRLRRRWSPFPGGVVMQGAEAPLVPVTSRRLLIIACSDRKYADDRLLPATQRYDGPAFRVLRRYLREQPPEPPAIRVLSAEFGLIDDTTLIPRYDRGMTLERA